MQGWVVNVTPWLVVPPITLLAKVLTDYLISKNWSLTNVRKFIQSICFLGQNCALFVMCHTNNFNVALVSMSIIIGEYSKSLSDPLNVSEQNKTKYLIPNSSSFRSHRFSQHWSDCEPSRSRANIFRECFWTDEYSRSNSRLFRRLFSWSHFRIDSKVCTWNFRWLT